MRTSLIMGVAVVALATGCSSPTSPTVPDPGDAGAGATPPTARVVPIALITFSRGPGRTVPAIRATFRGRTMTSPGYYVFNLPPGTYELTGTLVASSIPDSRDTWAGGFSTYRGLGDPPPITDNGVAPGSINSVAGPNPSFIRRNCEVDYAFSGPGEREFRISFRVTATRATGATCPVQT